MGFKRPKKKDLKREELVVETDVIETKGKDVEVEEEFTEEDTGLILKSLQASEDIALYLRVQKGAAEYALFLKLSD